MTAEWNSRAGKCGERIAAEYLELVGCVILERNVRSGHLEIDLVVREGSCVAFVEVKLRRGSSFGGAVESIHTGKLRRLRRAAGMYLASASAAVGADEYRFDCVALDVKPEGGLVLRHLRGIG